MVNQSKLNLPLNKLTLPYFADITAKTLAKLSFVHIYLHILYSHVCLFFINLILPSLSVASIQNDFELDLFQFYFKLA